MRWNSLCLKSICLRHLNLIGLYYHEVVKLNYAYVVPGMNCYAIPLVTGLHSILVFTDSLLKWPPNLTNVDCFTVHTREPVYYFLPLHVWYWGAIACEYWWRVWSGLNTAFTFMLLHVRWMISDSPLMHGRYNIFVFSVVFNGGMELFLNVDI